MRRLAAIGAIAAAVAAWALAPGAGADGSRSYVVEMHNAFGIFDGSDVRVNGVRAGTVSGVTVNASKRAEVTIELSGPLAELGDRTTCSTEPQSLIAEYFIDCSPAGPPLAEGGLIPADRVTQTVQTDLVLSALRRPHRERVRLIVNELGTAMAGNGENLNEAIRLAAPALTDIRRVTRILAAQRDQLRAINTDGERVITRLAERSGDVTGAIAAARDTAAAGAERRADLARDADRLDDVTAELRPTLARLGEVAREGTPLLRRLRAAAPGLSALSGRLPPFSRDATRSLTALGAAAVPATVALREGRDEVASLRRAGRAAPAAAEILADFARDIDDPRRVIEEDARAERTCDDPTRPCWSTGRAAPTGYTGLEGLINYTYYQTLAINQFDAVGHLLHFNAFEVGEGPCGPFNAGPTVPKEGGGRTTNILEADPCVAWLGRNQADISYDLNLPPYHPSVCPDGSTHPELCDPPGRGGARGAGPAPKADPTAVADYLLGD